MKPVYHPAFKAGFDDALGRYREVSQLLADRFQTEVKEGVRAVLGGMVDHAAGPHGFRCYRCKKFPYLVYYERTGKTVLFLAVLYVGRDARMLTETLARYRKSR